MLQSVFARVIPVSTLLFLLLMLQACGGGSLESDTNEPVAAVLVNAGGNQTVNEATTITLSADASGQTQELTYSWSSSPAITITQASSASADATIETPVTTEELVYNLTLLVTDGNGNQGSDTVEYRVVPVNESPISSIVIIKPTETAEDDKYPAGIEMTLDGSGSNDADPQDPLNPISEYRWQQTAGTDVLNSVSLDGDSIAFITPIEANSNQLTFELTVTDNEGGVHTSSIDITVQSQSETLPTVSAGIDHQVYTGESIMLTGVASTTIPAAQPLSYRWLNDSELVPIIDSSTSLRTFAIAPQVSSTQLVTFTLEVTDSFGNSVDDSVAIRVKPLPLTTINDTGVTQQATNSAITTLHQADFPGQDGQRGHDVIAQHGLLEKAGRGNRGFDFTRLDEIGDEVDDTTQPWRCVRDNVTGLIWEVKIIGIGAAASDHSYSWLQTATNGGNAGDLNGAGTSCSIANCNTRDYINRINEIGLCNFFDWRLPSYKELLSIVHFGQDSSPLVDTNYFPNTASNINPPLYYWTRISNADGVSDDVANNAWVIDFSTGNDNFINKSTPARVRLVRGGR